MAAFRRESTFTFEGSSDSELEDTIYVASPPTHSPASSKAGSKTTTPAKQTTTPKKTKHTHSDVIEGLENFTITSTPPRRGVKKISPLQARRSSAPERRSPTYVIRESAPPRYTLRSTKIEDAPSKSPRLYRSRIEDTPEPELNTFCASSRKNPPKPIAKRKVIKKGKEEKKRLDFGLVFDQMWSEFLKKEMEEETELD